MASSLVSNAYLDEGSAKIRSKPVPWEGYERAHLVTAEELQLIKRIDRQSKAKAEAILLNEGPTYALLYLRLLNKLQSADTIQCILVLIADALVDHPERVRLFTNATEHDPDLPFAPLLKICRETQNEFVELKVAQILTIIFNAETTPLDLSYFRPFLSTLASLVRGQSANSRDTAVQCLEALVSRSECRQYIWADPSITTGLVNILKYKPGPQMSYQVIFCLWLLSFDQQVAQQINRKYDIIPLLIDVAQGAVKEKVIRVVVATFRNLVTKAPSENLPAMLVAELLPFAKNLCARKWSDEDILEDVQFLRDELAANFQSLTTYDEYTSELVSGHLSWTPVHESEDFWKENATKLNDKDYQQLKTLIRLLKESRNPTVLAVAAHDVGQYVKHCDRGKKLVTDLGGKARVMELMSHEDSEVRYRALISVQQLVSQPWVTV